MVSTSWGQIEPRFSATSVLKGAVFLAATAMQIIAYRSMEPAFVALIFMLLGYASLHKRLPWGGYSEGTAFVLIFSVGYFWSGVTAIFANVFNDPIVNSDAAWFYGLAIDFRSNFDFGEMRAITNGAVHIYAWRLLYGFFSAIGFQQGAYIAVIFNTFLVAISGVIGVKTAALIFANDSRMQARLSVIIASCGMFWLFASVVLRDSSVLLLNSVLILIWVKFLMRPTLSSTVGVIGVGAISQVVYLNLRAELLLAPTAMALAAISSVFVLKMFSSSVEIKSNGFLGKILLCLFASVLTLLAIYIVTGFNVFNAAASTTAQYIGHAGSADSLGSTYVLNQPLLIRWVVGAYYINVFPIPFWHGFGVGNIYHIFKSFNAIFMWFVIPLAALGFYKVVKHGAPRQRLGLLFLVVVYLGFSFGVAATSLESRHLASFLMPLLILAAVPDFDCQQKKNTYFKVFGGWMLVITLTHLAWYGLKQLGRV